MGLTIKKGGKFGNFGMTDLDDSVEFDFDELNPVVGIYGNNDSADFVNGLGMITYDLGAECQAYIPPPELLDEPVVESIDEVIKDGSSQETAYVTELINPNTLSTSGNVYQ